MKPIAKQQQDDEVIYRYFVGESSLSWERVMVLPYAFYRFSAPSRRAKTEIKSKNTINAPRVQYYAQFTEIFPIR